MKISLLLSNLIFVLTILLTGCTTNITGEDGNTELSRELTTSEKKLIESGQSFSFNIFRSTVASENDDNIFISPLSISVALGMTLNGAGGETYNQMRETLAFHNLDLETINSGYESLIELLKTADPKVKMEIANSVWAKKGFPVEEDFITQLEEYFNAKAQELDFEDPKSTEVINDWVNENTNGLIDSIIEGQIPPEMVMYLINAIYFKGDWTYQFDKDDTRESPFYLENGENVTVDMMNQKGDFNIYRSDDVQMIDLPYGDSLFSMSIMMPGDPEIPLDDFIENKFTNDNFNNWIANLSNTNSPISMPKFELEYKIKLNNVLQGMGMEDAFNATADFSGINPNADLFISEVMHKTYVKVDEEGTEAAAVTSVGIGVTSAPPSFDVNRPFVFVIREQNSGAILFVGKVKNPAI